MPRSALMGTRIRETRLRRGLRQAELARQVGVSPSYLNLIEHNRRRPGAALAEALGAALQIPPGAFAEDAQDPLLDALREAAAAGQGFEAAELERIEEFVGRFPGWAELLAGQGRRLAALEQTVERLSDRMTHDPYLSAALHDVLSAISSVRSTAAILAESDDIDPGWRQRFHANLHADSERLGAGAQALVSYLDNAEDEEMSLAAPQEELEAWLAAQEYHVAALEHGSEAAIEALIADAPELATRPARALAARFLHRYRADARALPLGPFLAALRALGPDPAALAARFDAPLPMVLRRIAALPPREGVAQSGLVLCDASGTLVFRKPVQGFAFPRFGAACPLWPLYQALLQPARPIHRRVEMAGRMPRRFQTYAICSPHPSARFDAPMVVEATMLILPAEAEGVAADGGAAEPVGTSCRICPREGCPARREPSILTEEF